MSYTHRFILDQQVFTKTLQRRDLQEVIQSGGHVYEKLQSCHPVLVSVDMAYDQDTVLRVVWEIQQTLIELFKVNHPRDQVPCIVREDATIIYYFPYLSVPHNDQKGMLMDKLRERLGRVLDKDVLDGAIYDEEWEVTANDEDVVMVSYIPHLDEDLDQDVITPVTDPLLLSMYREVQPVMPRPTNKDDKKVQDAWERSQETRVFDDVKTLRELLPMVSVERDPVEVGQVVYDVCDGSPDGYNMWVEWNSEIMDPMNKWALFTKSHYTIEMIKKWASEDSPEDFEAWSQQDIATLMDFTVTSMGGHADVADILYKMYGQKFICADIRRNVWYEFKEHRWNDVKCGVSLRNMMRTQLRNMYQKFLKRLGEQCVNAEEDERDKLVKKMENCEKMIKKLADASFKVSLMKECNDMFYDRDFDDKMDMHQHLLCFRNGVYDLYEDEFRAGRPEDYCVKFIDYEYQEYTWDDPNVQYCLDQFKKVYVDEDLVEAVLVMLASGLKGGNEDKILPFFIGERGNNGKSAIRNWYINTLGQYGTTVPSTILTRGQSQADVATPSLERMNKSRIAFIDEPDAHETIHPSQIKKITGNDTFYSRAMYSEGRDIKPTCKLIVISNKPPSVPATEKVIWNRIMVVPHLSQFLPKNDSKLPHNLHERYEQRRFEADHRMTTSEYVNELRAPLMWILIQKFKTYQKHGLKWTESIQLATEQYKTQNDTIKQYIELRVVEREGSVLYFEDLYNAYRIWYEGHNPGKKAVDGETFKSDCIEHLGPLDSQNTWHGYHRTC